MEKNYVIKMPTFYMRERKNLGFQSGDESEHHILPLRSSFDSLWAPSYFVASAGEVSSETIQAYIEGQYD